MYVASPKLNLGLDDAPAERPGWGVFPKFNPRLLLPNPNRPGASHWRLPRWFYPDGNKRPLSYHPDLKRWQRDTQHAYRHSVGRGQEFLLNLAGYPEATGWLPNLVRDLT